MTTKTTRTAQLGLFPVGRVEVPVLPAINATTVVFPDTTSLTPLDRDSLSRQGRDPYENFYYGGVGTPTTEAFGQAVAKLEGGTHAVLAPSGQSALVATLSALLKQGDHVLVVDTVTYTTRWYLDQCLAASGVTVTYYPPEVTDLEPFLRPNTRVVFMESPGSMTFEVQDVPALCKTAARHGITTVLDNTWAASRYFEPFEKGADVSVLSLTKYHAGPAGVSMGAVVTRQERLHATIKNQAALLGLHVNPDACARAMLALATLDLRLNQQERTTEHVLRSLTGLSGLGALFHPSLPGAPGHALWRRDFMGANSLVTLVFEGLDRAAVHARVDRFRVVRIGYGWGGMLSLATLFEVNAWRTVSGIAARGMGLRLYLGLEDPADLVADLRQALEGR
ncbi:aminotransferase class V-fold PLP-dependent enzyme [Pyxidicoccus parkwayensis]|uniref:Aminotransferase class V-fold PLP-dependent enzyme n=1 Tax=Pyxidicoccus parkwayensis TaxID=2813578 RepID=A0ABX7P838_9BACT|nr:aminotransferase class I/II-fold pyridoxal phosphate-dependent enzyme [Pyxidicoccus parkwaysis]QSQ26612.1 aminotransferase class V-fold PLP-dependent enzyme [Pyxidicoccus parkwaysis]